MSLSRLSESKIQRAESSPGKQLVTKQLLAEGRCDAISISRMN